MSVLYNIIIFPIVQIVEFVFSISYRIFLNAGISVLFVSLAISVLCLPLYAVAEQWQEKERATQKKLQSGIKRIKTTFTGDEQYMMLSAYYRENHYHPIMALRSSFGLLIQIPFFIAAYSYLSHLAQLKGASFLFLKDLGAPDGLLKLGAFNLNLLPIVMTLINCLSGAIYTRGFALKDKIQLYGLALVFLVLLYPSPCALVLYWTMNNIFSLCKNVYYKVRSPYKSIVMCLLCAALLIFIAVYMNVTKRGRHQLRMILTFLLVAMAVVFVVVSVLRVLAKKRRAQKATVSERTVWAAVFAKNGWGGVFISAAVVLTLLLGLYVPANLIAASPEEFSYIGEYTTPTFFIWFTFAKAVGFCLFWPCCLFFLFGNTVKRAMAFLFSGLLFCALINLFFFKGNYGYISTVMVFDNGVGVRAVEIVLSTLALSLVALVLGLIFVLKKQRFLSIAHCLVLVALSLVSFVTLSSIKKAFVELSSYHTKESAAQVEKVEPIVSFSKGGRNVVVMMLDRASSILVPYILEESPELKTDFWGFTYYPNTISYNGFTKLGSPPIFGGFDATPLEVNKRSDVTLLQKRNEALSLMPRLFSENGFFVTATDLPYANGQQIPDLSFLHQYQNVSTYITDSRYTDLWCKEHNFFVGSESEVLKRNILLYSFLRTSVPLVRPGLYQDGNWCSLSKDYLLRKTLNAYAVLDYLPQLTGIKDDASDNALICVNNTTHEESLLQAPDYVPSLLVTDFGQGRFAKLPEYSVNAASFKRLAEWFSYLKENDVYDNTRIILVADHGRAGANMVIHNNLPFPQENFNPLLLVKDFGASGELKTDTAFMTNADVPYYALSGIIEHPVNPFTGNAITMDYKKEKQYVAVSGTQLSVESKSDCQYILHPEDDWYVSDDIFIEENWVPALIKKGSVKKNQHE